MSPRRKSDDGVHLPPSHPEPDYPTGDGPAWISDALGVPGCLLNVTRYASDDGEEAALVLHFTNGHEQLFRPARLVTTRRLVETLGALGFPIPYYQPPQLALLGQAIGRVADRSDHQEQESSAAEMLSVVASWASAMLDAHDTHVLWGRTGVDVRAAIEHIHRKASSTTAPLIYVPTRDVLLAWSVPLRGAIRERLGPTSDGTIGFQLRRGGLERERFAARPLAGQRTPHEIPVWVLYNGWHGVDVGIPPQSVDSEHNGQAPLESVVDPHTRARPEAHMHVGIDQRSTTPNAAKHDFRGA